MLKLGSVLGLQKIVQCLLHQSQKKHDKLFHKHPTDYKSSECTILCTEMYTSLPTLLICRLIIDFLVFHIHVARGSTSEVAFAFWLTFKTKHCMRLLLWPFVGTIQYVIRSIVNGPYKILKHCIIDFTNLKRCGLCKVLFPILITQI